MKTKNWLSRDLHDYVAVDLEDGRRLVLDKGDSLLIGLETISIRYKNGTDLLIPTVKVVQIYKRYKKELLSRLKKV